MPRSPPRLPPDQGFTCHSALPFHSFVDVWISALLEQLPSHRVENRSRVNLEFTLPATGTDEVLVSLYGVYPDDHVEIFKGDIDDSFRVVTRKRTKLFSEFYSSNIIVSSPLGLRQVIEKVIEKESNWPFRSALPRDAYSCLWKGNFLSSIEIFVANQLVVLSMQNWSHLQVKLTNPSPSRVNLTSPQ